MRFLRNVEFRKKVTIICMIPLLMISILIGAMSYSKVRSTASENSKQSLADAVNRVDISIATRSRLISSVADAIANSFPTVYDSENGAAEQMQELCRELTAPFREICSVTVVENTNIIFSTDSNMALTENTASLLLTKAMLNGGKPVWLSSLPENMADTASETLLVLRALSEQSAGRHRFLILTIDPGAMGEMLLSKQKTLGHQITAIVNSSFHMLYQDNSISYELQRSLIEQYKAGKRYFTISQGQTDFYCVTQYNGLTGWITISFIDETDLFPDAANLLDFIVLLVVLCVLAAYILLRVLSGSVTKPLGRLNEAMKQVQYKHLDVRLPVDSEDEIGELTESFNYMMDRIHTLISRIYEEKLAQKNAEIEALQAQINPHFLYNTLDSINWMLIDRGEMEISAVVVALGKLMQYSMDTSASLVPLQMEYANALDYLTVQKNRLESKLEYQLELPADFEEFLIPKLTLQPLIENAIKHGIIPSDRRGMLTIRTVQEKARIIISVQDNGDGMDEEHLERFKRLLSGKADEPGSIGVRNVARRLQLHFNGLCKFSVESSSAQGTTVRLMLPMTGKREGE